MLGPDFNKKVVAKHNYRDRVNFSECALLYKNVNPTTVEY